MANEKDTAGQAAEGAARRTGEAVSAMAKGAATTAREGTETARGMAEDQRRRLSQLFGLQSQLSENAATRSSQTIGAMVQCGSVLADGWQSILREWMSYTQTAMQRNVDGVGEMMRSRTLDDFVTSRDKLLREELELWMSNSVRVSEMAARTSSDAIRHLHGAADKKGKAA
jgi:Phasin protein